MAEAIAEKLSPPREFGLTARNRFMWTMAGLGLPHGKAARLLAAVVREELEAGWKRQVSELAERDHNGQPVKDWPRLHAALMSRPRLTRARERKSR